MRRQFSLDPTITTVSWQSLMITTIVSICLHFPFPPNTKSEIFIYGWRFFLKTLMQKSCKAEHIFVHTTAFLFREISATGQKYVLPQNGNVVCQSRYIFRQGAFLFSTTGYFPKDRNILFHGTEIFCFTGRKYFLPLSLFSQYIGAFTPACLR